MPKQPLAYHDHEFLESTDARPIRILAEYLEPARRFRRRTSRTRWCSSARRACTAARTPSSALQELQKKRGRRTAEHARLLKRSRKAVKWSRYYEEARELANRLTEWSLSLEEPHRRFVVMLGRRPGHHGGGQSRRLTKPAARRSASTSGCRSSRGPTGTSPRGCTSSSTTSSCGSSGSRTWPRRW